MIEPNFNSVENNTEINEGVVENAGVENNLESEIVQNTEAQTVNIQAENIPQSVQGTIANIQDDTSTSATNSPEINESEVKEEFTSQIDTSSMPFVAQTKEIIEKYKDNPYQEEEASEDLQIDYMKKRFNVDIEKKEHN